MKPIKILAATGMLGTGFSEKSFNKALDYKPDMIGCDAGSIDPGPYFLGSNETMSSREATKRDLRIMLKASVKHKIPLLVGSAGTGGSNQQVDWTVDIIEEISKEEGLSFKMAFIYSELNKDKLLTYYQQGKVTPLDNAPDLNEEKINNLTRIVGQMGPEPYIQALKKGAQVIIAGRSSDTSIYAAVPIMKGLNTGSVWHAAKIIECGAGCVEKRIYPDCMIATLYPDHFVISPPNPDMKCTPASVVSHLLYENTDPYILHEPTGILDTTRSVYTQKDERSVKVSNSIFIRNESYTVKLEAVEMIGYRRIAIGGIRDPYILRQLPNFLKYSEESIKRKVSESLGIEAKEYTLIFRVYGESGVMSRMEPRKGNAGHEVGLLIEVVANTPEMSKAIMSITWHTVLHNPIKEWSGLVSNVAYPFSPPDADMGPAYQFALNHVVEVDDPCELFQINYIKV